MILFANTKAIPQRKTINMRTGLMNRNNDIPDDLIATNSNLSPRLPNVINEENKTASGSASGTNEAL